MKGPSRSVALHTEVDGRKPKAELKQGWSNSGSSLPRELVKPRLGYEPTRIDPGSDHAGSHGLIRIELGSIPGSILGLCTSYSKFV
jgi:hypothetical protein